MSQNTTVKSTPSNAWTKFWKTILGNSAPVDTSYAANTESEGVSSVLWNKMFGNTSAEKSPTYGEMVNGASGANPSGTSSGATGSVNSGTVSAGSGTSGITGDLDTYEKYLQNTQNTYKDIYTEQTNFYDQQNKETVAAIEEQKNADMTYAANQYQLLIDSINQAKESGTKLAKEQYDLLINMSEEQRDMIYKAAETQRAEEYRLAEIERERGVVDARTSYAQNMATYGANAERMDRMGLTGSGYSDYVNAQAYATQRAETQAANAQSEAAKREARYAENQAKIDADLSYNENQYNAQSQYSKDMYDVDTTYAQNMADANAQKGAMDYEADSTARSDTLAANQTAATGKHEASLSYKENLLANEGEFARYRQEKEDEAKEKAEQEAKEAADKDEATETNRNNAYLSILSSPGSYSTEDIDSLAKMYGFTPEQVTSLKTAVDKATEERIAEKTKAETEAFKATSSQNYQTVSANIKADPNYYTDAELDNMVDTLLTREDAKLAKQLKKDTQTQFAKDDIDSYIASGDIEGMKAYVEEAYNGGNGVIDLDTYQDAYFRAALQNCVNASGSSELFQVEADLKNLMAAGKISSADCDAAIKYMYSLQGGVLNPSSYTATLSSKLSVGTGRTTTTLNIELDGKTYSITMKKTATAHGTYSKEIETADETTAKVLTGIIGGGIPNQNTLVMYNGQLYLYSGGWCKVQDRDGLYSKYNTLCGYQAKPAAPKHSSSPSENSGKNHGYKGSGMGYRTYASGDNF